MDNFLSEKSLSSKIKKDLARNDTGAPMTHEHDDLFLFWGEGRQPFESFSRRLRETLDLDQDS
ncbi:hypothetical protein HC62_03100 [Acetobacter tropicalis]|uniref:Uncharacterized protein n=1 Tax=Acetobacter tropicalis TaxID=104102 RepID=A0A251ZXZ6_9PROT|nr:hypothetical protein HC62_03100 [Acetobacter tropicalis]